MYHLITLVRNCKRLATSLLCRVFFSLRVTWKTSTIEFMHCTYRYIDQIPVCVFRRWIKHFGRLIFFVEEKLKKGAKKTLNRKEIKTEPRFFFFGCCRRFYSSSIVIRRLLGIRSRRNKRRFAALWRNGRGAGCAQREDGRFDRSTSELLSPRTNTFVFFWYTI